MKLQAYLRNRGLENLCDEFKIKINRHSSFSNLVCLKYSQLESPMAETIVQQCRGIILNEANDWEIISYPYRKFFNYGEVHAPCLDWQTAKVYEKLDGSLMTLYYYRNKWRVQSSGSADASGKVYGNKFSFADLFNKVWQELNYQLPQETNCCFMFELMTPYNRIVVKQNCNNLILHGVRNLDSLQEIDPSLWINRYNWQIVTTHSLKTLDEIILKTEQLDPLQSEGYIICDRYFNRIKVKSSEYVAISHLKDGFSTRRIIEIVITNEGEEFLSYYPEWTDLYNRIHASYEKLVAEIEANYAKYQTIYLQKDFAAAVINLPYAGILFALRSGKSSTIKQSLQNTSIAKVEQLLKIDFQELF
jgi:hypothetical protein